MRRRECNGRQLTCHVQRQQKLRTGKSETTTTATTLSAGRVGGDGGDVLNAANAHAGTGERTEGGLGTGAGGLGAGTTSGTQLDVESGDADLLASDGAVLSGKHGSVGRRLVTVGLDLHTTCEAEKQKMRRLENKIRRMSRQYDAAGSAVPQSGWSHETVFKEIVMPNRCSDAILLAFLCCL